MYTYGVIVIVHDATSLILLAKASILRIVLTHYKSMTPSIIQRECTRESDREDAMLIAQVIDEGLIEIREPKKSEQISTLAKDFQLHRGESAALLLALETRSALATDDFPARKVCRILNVRSIIAVAFLESLAERRLISPELALEKLKYFERYGRYKAETIKAVMEKISTLDKAKRG